MSSKTPSTFSVLHEILKWSKTRPDWQRDALRRLFQKQNLNAQDIDDLYAMLKSSQGVADPQNRQPVLLASEHLPAQAVNAAPVVLLRLHNLQHVNRLIKGGEIKFAPKGITVIYGANASGKSGYSRVLKRACRARDLSETVHPDASDPKAATNLPQATFDIEVGKTTSSVDWIRGQAPPDELSSIAVFDSRCARAYLDNEQDVAYVPYGLDIVENLGQKVLPELMRCLDAEIATINTDTSPFADLHGDTAVGKMIASLNATTDHQRIKELATLTTIEEKRLGELNTTLAESDPKSKSKAMRLSAQRIDDLITRIEKALAWVDDAMVEKFKVSDSAAEVALKAETLAAEKFQADDTFLPGTGGQVWKGLFEAARRFSTEIAYPAKPFPHVIADAQCPLCQQLLSDTAQKRMQRFDEFVKRATAMIADEKRQQRNNETVKITSASLDFGLDKATTEELKQLDEGLLQSTQNFEKIVNDRRTWLLKAAIEHVFDAPQKLDGDPRANLKTLSQKIINQANELDQVGNAEQRKTLEAERKELQARVSFSPHLEAVLDLIQRMKRKATLTKCKDDFKTKAISDKAKEFASQAVTAALQDALNAEFKKLGVEHIKTKLNDRVEKGKMKHKLVLDLSTTRNLNEILSEGEQRAIAIGSFLAELHMTGHKGGIVFDDPVSSLDHHQRMKVASRLIEEAMIRQVIVFTHDTVFLGELCHEVENRSIEHLVCHLEWMNGYPGYVSKGLPWEHMKVKERLDKMEKAQQDLEKSWPTYPNADDRAKMRIQYNSLRSTIERVIQDVIFGGVVQRYRDWISVHNLGDVVGFAESEYAEIERLYQKCNDLVSAHDHSSAKNASVPDAKELGNDIDALKKVIDSIKDRQKQKKQLLTSVKTSATP